MQKVPVTGQVAGTTHMAEWRDALKDDQPGMTSARLALPPQGNFYLF